MFIFLFCDKLEKTTAHPLKTTSECENRKNKLKVIFFFFFKLSFISLDCKAWEYSNVSVLFMFF